MAERDYAIVCDATCDLSAAFLEVAGVELAAAPAGQDGETTAEALARTYRSLAERGFPRVMSLHSCASFSPVVDAAREAARDCADVVDVAVVDSGAGSVVTGMLVDRAARYRRFDVGFDDVVAALLGLAEQSRLLAVPAAGSPLARRRTSRRRMPLSRASGTKVRITGDRGLYLLFGSELTQLARNPELSVLAERMARGLVTVSERVGRLACALSAADDHARHVVETALDAAGVETRWLGAVRMSPQTQAVMGEGAVAVAVAPEEVYDRPAEDLLGLGSHAGTTGNEA